MRQLALIIALSFVSLALAPATIARGDTLANVHAAARWFGVATAKAAGPMSFPIRPRPAA